MYEEICQQVSMYDVLKLFNIKTNGDRTCCPIHKGNNRLAFSIYGNGEFWTCFSGCGSGNVITFVAKILNKSNYESALFLIDKFSLKIDKKKRNNIALENKKWIKKVQKNNSTETLQEFNINEIGEMIEIGEYRGFSKEFLSKHGILFCKNNNRVVIPIKKDGIVVGVVMRATTEHPLKYLNKPKEMRFSHTLFNYDNVDGDTVIVTEGIFDTLSYDKLGYNAVATFTSHMSKEQEKMLLKKFTTLIMGYDNDNAGIKGTINAINRLKNISNVYVANIPGGKDPNEMTEAEIHSSIKNKLTWKEWLKCANVIKVIEEEKYK
jgi:DNA primase